MHGTIRKECNESNDNAKPTNLEFIKLTVFFVAGFLMSMALIGGLKISNVGQANQINASTITSHEIQQISTISPVITDQFSFGKVDHPPPISGHSNLSLATKENEVFHPFQSLNSTTVCDDKDLTCEVVSPKLSIIDEKLRQVRRMLHDSTPLITTYCRVSGKSASKVGEKFSLQENALLFDDGASISRFSVDSM